MAETTNSQQQSSASKTTDESSQSVVQNQTVASSDREMSKHTCICETKCANQQCGCVKANTKSGQRCKCLVHGCDNQPGTANSQQQSSALKTTDKSSQSVSQNQTAADSDREMPKHTCSCKTKCANKQCGSVKANTKSGQRCKCLVHGCDNQPGTANSQQQSSASKTTDKSSQSVSQNQTVASSDREMSKHTCICETKCANQQCGCVKANTKRGQRCKCLVYGCYNQPGTANSQQQSSASKTTDESSQSVVQNQTVANSDREMPKHTCSCKTKCANKQCGSVKANTKSGQRCKCLVHGCDNQPGTANSQQQSSASKTTDKSSQSVSQNQTAADSDREMPKHTCSCKTKCANKQCGSVKANTKSGQRCKCLVHGCDNQPGTANSQQQSSASKTTDKSSQSVSQNQTVASSDREMSKHTCICETKCANQQCGCVKANTKRGQRCKCLVYGCYNQPGTANSQQQSSASKTTDESSQSVVQNQTVANSDREMPKHTCSCKTKCANQQCGCVKANTKCGQRCKCLVHGCDNQPGTANSQQQSSASKTTDKSSQSVSQNQTAASSDREMSKHTCICETKCANQQCGCVKANTKSGQRCKCLVHGCDNQPGTANSQQQSSASKTTDKSSQSVSQNQTAADSDREMPKHTCSCKTKCANKQCGSVKANTKSGQRCKCLVHGCDNQPGTANSQQQSSASKTTDKSSQSVSQNQTVASSDREMSKHTCICETKCANQQCGCVKANTKRGQRCKCLVYGCYNQPGTANSQQQSSASKTTDESSQSVVQNQTVANSDREMPKHTCSCKTKCANQQCGCVKANTKCGQRCKCLVHGCDNQPGTANSQQQSSASKTTDKSSQSVSQNQTVASSDREMSKHTCICETKCANQQCGCVKANTKSGQRCKCLVYGCYNQPGTANSQQQSSASKTTDESSQSVVQNQTVANSDREMPKHTCSCKTKCANKQCGSVKANTKSGQRCKCLVHGCDNQPGTANSQQQSSASKTTDKSSQSVSQNQTAADSDREIPSKACNCEAGCSTLRCGCVKGGIPCGQGCKCRSSGCDNQGGKSCSQ